jgi:hypothetical protein
MMVFNNKTYMFFEEQDVWGEDKIYRIIYSLLDSRLSMFSLWIYLSHCCLKLYSLLAYFTNFNQDC